VVLPPIDVCIYAEGVLPADEVSELADLGIHSHVDHVVLDGTVVDQAALIGVLERLRRAGLQIRDVAPAARDEDGEQVAFLSFAGRAGDLLRAVLDDAVVTEDETTTTAEVVLSRADDLFDMLGRLGALGLELRAVHVGRSSDPLP
jgi:hypothetical protein